MAEATKTIILAGGEGARLRPLTDLRAKPAVPFGGKYRIIDFVLSNCLHSKLRKIYVLPQYEPASLQAHLNNWSRIFSSEMGEYLEVLNPRSQADRDLAPYVGTADAVFQNMKHLFGGNSAFVLILAGDQIYKMDYRGMIEFHQTMGADITMAAVEIGSREVAQRSGVVEIAKNRKVIDFKEKPDSPKPLPTKPDNFFISMSAYVFSLEALVGALEEDSRDKESKHDFGKNIIPKALGNGQKIFAFPLLDKETGGPGYWRDVGTLESYYEANMDLCSVKPAFNLHDANWFWRTPTRQLPPTKIVFRMEAKESIICEGCIIDDAGIYRSIISPEVRIGRNVVISNSIIMRGVQIGDNVRIDRAIIDKENEIPSGSVIGSGDAESKIVAVARKERSLYED